MVSYKVIAILLVVVLHFWFGGCAHKPVTSPNFLVSEETREPSNDNFEGLTYEAFMTIKKFSEVGFGCVKKDKATRCVIPQTLAPEVLAGYNRSVAILIPNQLENPQSNEAAINRFLYFFHGHDVKGRGFEWYLSNFNIDKQFEETGFTRTILIVPASKGNCEDFQDFFALKPKKFDEFNFAIMRILGMNPSQLSSISLSGHSGSYRTLANIATNETREQVPLLNTLHPLINQLGLLDATYGDTERFYKWTAQDQRNRKLIMSCATEEPCAGMSFHSIGSLPNITRREIQKPNSYVAIDHYDVGIQCLRATWEAKACN
ncbi:MAG: hypothetical protein AB7O96_11915 [Pseudobdellovibrionaceae bacterium]